MQKSTVNKFVKVVQSGHSALQQVLQYLESIFNDLTIFFHCSVLEDAEKAITETMVNNRKDLDIITRKQR